MINTYILTISVNFTLSVRSLTRESRTSLFISLSSLICVMGKKKKKFNMPKDPIKAMKKAARDIELEMGVRFTYNHPHKSKKHYNRKNKDWKKDIQSLNFPSQVGIIPLYIINRFQSGQMETN